jgi:hypothetical protein
MCREFHIFLLASQKHFTSFYLYYVWQFTYGRIIA